MEGKYFNDANYQWDCFYVSRPINPPDLSSEDEPFEYIRFLQLDWQNGETKMLCPGGSTSFGHLAWDCHATGVGGGTPPTTYQTTSWYPAGEYWRRYSGSQSYFILNAASGGTAHRFRYNSPGTNVDSCNAFGGVSGIIRLDLAPFANYTWQHSFALEGNNCNDSVYGPACAGPNILGSNSNTFRVVSKAGNLAAPGYSRWEPLAGSVTFECGITVTWRGLYRTP